MNPQTKVEMLDAMRKDYIYYKDQLTRKLHVKEQIKANSSTSRYKRIVKHKHSLHMNTLTRKKSKHRAKHLR